MNRPLVAVLAGLIALGTVNFVMAAAPGTIQNVFVTNWPRNQNVTVTNPPTVTTNVTVNFPPKVEPKVMILAENRSSVTWPQADTYTFSAHGYAALRITIDGQALTQNSVTMILYISVKNGPVETVLTGASFQLTYPSLYTSITPFPAGTYSGYTTAMPADSNEFVLRVSASSCSAPYGVSCTTDTIYTLTVYLMPEGSPQVCGVVYASPCYNHNI